jgi:SNF family Na+-dependent transporter
MHNRLYYKSYLGDPQYLSRNPTLSASSSLTSGWSVLFFVILFKVAFDTEMRHETYHQLCIKWAVTLLLFISWMIIMGCALKGVCCRGKVVGFANLSLAFNLIPLLVSGLTQTGAWEVIKYFIIPDIDKLFRFKVFCGGT